MAHELTQETIDAVAAIFDKAVAEHRMAGVAWGIASGGEVLASGGAGSSALAGGERAEGAFTPRVDSISRIASMTKSFTAATILALRDEGKLRLDDPIATYVPAAAHIGSFSEDSPALTLRHALTMSAGFVTDNPWGDRQESMSTDEFDEYIAGGLSLIAEPGCGFEYSNTGFVLLGRVIDEVTGMSFRDEIRRRFIDPLGMKDTVFSLSEMTDDQRSRVLTGHRVGDGEGAKRFEDVDFDTPGAFGAMAGLFSTVADVAKWTAFLAEVGVHGADGISDDSRAILSPASRREMQEIHRIQEWPVLEDGNGFGRVRGYGYGLVVEKFPKLGDVISHSGGYPGYGSYMVWLRGTGLTVIALANSKYAPAIPCSLDALEAIRTHQAELVDAPKRELAPTTRDALEKALAWLRDVELEGQPTTLVPSGSARTVLATRAEQGVSEESDPLLALFATNMDQDVSRAERVRLRDAALRIAGLGRADLTLEKAASLKVLSPFQAVCTFEGESGKVLIDLLMDPRKNSQIQALNIKGESKDKGEASGAAPIGI
ncbi:MAG: serine hydrolase domain-containing protein [Dermabacter sp.]|nr:serine hydrolase domain-containing protein [Dermabacter sp.]